jgi:hypothetical protein
LCEARGMEACRHREQQRLRGTHRRLHRSIDWFGPLERARAPAALSRGGYLGNPIDPWMDLPRTGYLRGCDVALTHLAHRYVDESWGIAPNRPRQGSGQWNGTHRMRTHPFATRMPRGAPIGPVDSRPNVLLGCAASLPYGVSRRRHIRT